MTITSQIGQDVWDVALQVYGGAEGLSWLLEDNPSLIDGSGELPAGRVIYQVREGRQKAFEEKFSIGLLSSGNPSEYRSNMEQTVWDVALQFSGDASGIFELLEKNPFLIQGDGLVAEGRVLHRVDMEIRNRPVWSRMINYFPTTGLKKEGQPWITEGNEPWITDDGQEWWTE